MRFLIFHGTFLIREKKITLKRQIPSNKKPQKPIAFCSQKREERKPEEQKNKKQKQKKKENKRHLIRVFPRFDTDVKSGLLGTEAMKFNVSL